jgi:hypothetical protein
MASLSLEQRLYQINSDISAFTVTRDRLLVFYNRARDATANLSSAYYFQDLVRQGESKDTVSALHFATTTILPWRHTLPVDYFPTVLRVIPEGFPSNWTFEEDRTFFRKLSGALEIDISVMKVIRDFPCKEEVNDSTPACGNPGCIQLEAELRAKIKSLELDLYWKDHGIPQLREAMYKANNHRSELKCSCMKCVEAGFYYGCLDKTIEHCKFRPWLHACIAQCGLTIASPESYYEISRHPSADPGYVCAVDADLVNIQGDLFRFTFGSRIYTQALDSEAIEKLNLLYKLLDQTHV